MAIAHATEPTPVHGTAPTVEPGQLSQVSNAQTINSRIRMSPLDEGFLWFGPYEKHGEPRLYRYPVSTVFPPGGGAYLTPDDKVHSVPIDVRTQGAAFDSEGKLWLS